MEGAEAITVGNKPPLLVSADLIHKTPASIRYAPMDHVLAVAVEPIKVSSRRFGVAYESRKTDSAVL